MSSSAVEGGEGGCEKMGKGDRDRGDVIHCRQVGQDTGVCVCLYVCVRARVCVGA